MIENHMVLPVPEHKGVDLEPERTETCISCKTTGCRVDGGWYAETFLDDDGQLAGDGDYYPDADDTPHGWVCSKNCRSQAMYEHADKYGRTALRKVLDACHVVLRYGPAAIKLVEGGMGDGITSNLTDGANEFLEAIGEPKWMNEPSREETLASAAYMALHRLRSLSSDLHIEADSMARDGHTWSWRAKNQAAHAEEIAELEAALDAALKEM